MISATQSGSAVESPVTAAVEPMRIDISESRRRSPPCRLNYGGTSAGGDRIDFTSSYMRLNGKPYFALMGEFQFSKFPFRFWEDELLKMKSANIRIICTYVFWIHHEEEEGIFDWSGDRNLRQFVELCHRHGLYVNLRIGPFVHGECRNGGFPDWLYGRPFELRSNHPEYLHLVRRFYTEIGRQVAGKMFRDGGPIIGVQLENELSHAGAPWELNVRCGDTRVERGAGGEHGKQHLRMLRDLSIDAGMDVPIFSSTGWGGAPVIEDEILPMYGGYAFRPWVMKNLDRHPPTDNYLFRDYSSEGTVDDFFRPSYSAAKIPYACCELGGGMQVWYRFRFVVPPEAVEAMAIQKIGSGCNILGYFVFHGGLQPHGKRGFLNEHECPKIAYDFQAPLRDFGQASESYRALKALHFFLGDLGDYLATMRTALPDRCADDPTDTATVRCAARTKDGRGFLFFINFQDHAQTQDHHDVSVTVCDRTAQLQMPCSGGFTVSRNCSCILPFNLDLDGVLIRYATAQYLKKIMVGATAHYFFFAPDHMGTEFCIDMAGIERLGVEQGTLETQGENSIAVVRPGTGNTIRCTVRDGRRVELHTLSRDQALNFWVARIGGAQRAVISPATLIIAESRISVTSIGNAQLELDIFPFDGKPLVTDAGVLGGTPDGIFGKFTTAVPTVELPLSVEMRGDTRAVVNFKEFDMKSVNDVFLNIDYRGDVGQAHLGGRLIHDNFFNGTTWQIGLRNFMQEIVQKGLSLTILPFPAQQQQGSPGALDRVAMELPPEVDAEYSPGERARFLRIRAVAEYRLEIYTGRRD